MMNNERNNNSNKIFKHVCMSVCMYSYVPFVYPDILCMCARAPACVCVKYICVFMCT